MADFKTDFSAAQGAGTEAVAPVRQQVVPADTNWMRALSSVTDELGAFTKTQIKKNAQDEEDKVVKSYLDKERTFMAARDSGQWSPSRVTSASQSNFSEFIASNPKHLEALEKARKSIYGGTSIGEAQKDVDEARARRVKEQDMIDEAGLPTYPGKSEATHQAQVETIMKMRMLDKQFKRETDRNSEDRARRSDLREQGRFDQELADRNAADNAFQGLNTILSSNFDAFQSAMKDIVTGPMNYEQATAFITNHVAAIKAQGVALAGTRNQALVKPIVDIFEQLGNVSMEMKKPGAEKDRLQAEYDTLILKTKMAFMVDPKVRAEVVGSSLLPQNPDLILKSKSSVLDRLVAVEKADLSTPIFNIPSVVGNPDAEGAALDILTGALQKLHSGTSTGDKVKLEGSVTNSVNTMLRQTEDIVNRGATPKELTKIATFYASPEFGKLSASGKLDAATMQGAKRAFQAYNSATVGAVQREMSSDLWKDWTGKEPPKIQDMVNMEFRNGRVSFTPVATTPNMQKGSSVAVNSMRKSEDALTRLVVIGSHMEGTQDYAKYWEDNKHLLLPEVYADPKRFPPGYVNPANGWKFKGGVFFSKDNWEKPKEKTDGQ